MEQTEVGLQALDALVVEYLQQEELLEGSQLPQSCSERSKLSSHVRELIVSGDIDTALQSLESEAPQVLEDQRLLFRLKKQKFIETLRQHQADSDQAAIACAREELAPLALNAYPEAYLEFKKMLLLLIYSDGSSHSPVGQDWSPNAKQELAAMVYQTLRQQTGIQDPSLSLLLRYLLFLHTVLRPHCEGPLPESTLVDRLLLRERDPAPLPVEGSGAQSFFKEADVQAIMTGAGVPRQAALDALRRSQGDLALAFRSELARMRLNTCTLDQLVLEYASYRGLLEVPAESLVSSEEEGGAPPSASAATCRQDMDIDERPVAGPEATAGPELAMEPASPRSAPWPAPLASHPLGTTAGLCHSSRRQANGHATNHSGQSMPSPAPNPPPDTAPSPAAAGTPGWQAGGNGWVAGASPERTDVHSSFPRSASQSPPCKIPRWRGRQSLGSGTPDGPAALPSSSSRSPDGGSDLDCRPSAMCTQQYSVVLGLPRLLQAGQWDELVQVVAGLDPQLFGSNPSLLFEIKRCKYFQLVAQGDVGGALSLARAELSPLAEAHPNLLPALRSTMSTLLPGSSISAAQPDISLLTVNLQAALQARLGLEGPRLLRLMAALLQTHRTWFKLQRCSDPFAAELKLDSLRAALPPVGLETSGPPAAAGAAADAGGDKAVAEAEVPWPSSSEEEEQAVSEESILQLMEILEVNRAAAIELLLQSEGNIDAVMLQMFS